MFEDLIQHKDKEGMVCLNCHYGSTALSERLGMVKCQLYKRHKKPEDICAQWRNARHRFNLRKE